MWMFGFRSVVKINNMKKTVGVLDFQGGVEEHLLIIDRLGKKSVKVLSKEDLDGCDALIIPGGESTVIGHFLLESGLDKEIVARVEMGMSVMGTCAGAILLETLNLIDIEVERNAYGKQLDSFYSEIDVKGVGIIESAFIRAPKINSVGKEVEVLAVCNGDPVLVKQNNIIASTFHPELRGETKLHKFFLGFE